MSKFKGTKFRISTGPAAGASAKPISGITAANPPLVTATAHGLVNGDVIVLSGTNDSALDGPYLVEVLSETTFYLLNADWAARDALSGAGLTFTKQDLSQLCQITDLELNDMEATYETEANACGEEVTAKLSLGTISANGTWKPDLGIQNIMQDYFYSQEKFMVVHQVPGSNHVTGWAVYQAAFNKSGSASDDKYTAAWEWKVASIPGALVLGA